jgi:hypothetical protein
MQAKTIAMTALIAIVAIGMIGTSIKMAFAAPPVRPLNPNPNPLAPGQATAGNPGQGTLSSGAPPGQAAKPSPEGTCQWPVSVGEGHVICAPN